VSLNFSLKIRQSAITLTIKKFFQCKNEVKLGSRGWILECQGAKGLEGIEGKKTKKIGHNQVFHQVFQCKNEVKLRFGGRIWNTKELEV